MNSRALQSSTQKTFPRVYVDIDICRTPKIIYQEESIKEMTRNLNLLPTAMEEIAQAPALWMWDYLRRSGARGFFLPLSGGADSAAVSAIVASMARIILNSIQNGDLKTLNDLRKIIKNDHFVPKTF